MPKASEKHRDFMAVARSVAEKSIGEHMDGSPLEVEDPFAGKDPAAVSRGRLGGLKGGRMRALMMAPKRRSAVARKAAKVRWGKKPKKS
jgi:hypothetical protein